MLFSPSASELASTSEFASACSPLPLSLSSSRVVFSVNLCPLLPVTHRRQLTHITTRKRSCLCAFFFASAHLFSLILIVIAIRPARTRASLSSRLWFFCCVCFRSCAHAVNRRPPPRSRRLHSPFAHSPARPLYHFQFPVGRCAALRSVWVMVMLSL
jgi:hypothetical protein